MSSQKGNTNRSRPQKYKNCTKFENDKYDSSKKIKSLNNMKFQFLCKRCEDIIQWKIQYRKYKPLTVPAKCIKCEQKTVKAAYHHICNDCAEKLKICAKCGGNYDSELMSDDSEKVSEKDKSMHTLQV